MTRTALALVEAGDVPGRNPLLAPLGAALAARGVVLHAFDATRPWGLPPALPGADVYLLKGDDPAVLTAAGCLADQGAVCLNTFAATALAADKARVLSRLARAGVPVPATTVVADRAHLEAALADEPRFVKPLRGAHGLGAGILREAQAGRAGTGPWLVQEVVRPRSGRPCEYDLKVYGVHDRVAVRRVRTVPGVVAVPREPITHPDPALVRLAVAAAEAAGLVCWGADFLPGPEGPVLVDLNAFPGYRSVPEAGEWIADAVVEVLACAAA